MDSYGRKSWMWAEACALLEQAERKHRHFFGLLAAPTAQPVWEPPADIFAAGSELNVVVALPGAHADEVVKILTQYSFIKDPALHRAIVSQAIDPDGGLDMPSLQMAWQFFRDSKLIDGSISVDDVVDLSYVHAASKALGPYVKSTSMQ